MIKRQAAVMIAVGALMLIAMAQVYAGLVENGGFETRGSYIQKHTDVPSDPDTVALWKFDELSGTTAVNAQGDTANDGSLGNFNGISGLDVDVLDQSSVNSNLSEVMIATLNQFAQQFTPAAPALYAIEFMPASSDATGVNIEIQTDSGGVTPDGTAITNGTVSSGAITADVAKTVYFSHPLLLDTSTTYWIVIKRGSADIGIKGTGTGATGRAKRYNTGTPAWENIETWDDLYFKTYYRSGWTASGKSNGALVFDSLNDYVQVLDNDSLDLTNAITLEAWVYLLAQNTPNSTWFT